MPICLLLYLERNVRNFSVSDRQSLPCTLRKSQLTRAISREPFGSTSPVGESGDGTHNHARQSGGRVGTLAATAIALHDCNLEM